MEISNCSQHKSQHVARSPPETIQALLLWGILSRFNCNRTSYIFTEMHLAEFLSIFKTLLKAAESNFTTPAPVFQVTDPFQGIM